MSSAEVDDRRVGTCLPARRRRVPGWDPAAPGRFADAGSSSCERCGTRALRRTARSTGRSCASCEHCSAMPPCRMGSPIAHTRAGRVSSTSRALLLLCGLRCHAIVPEVSPAALPSARAKGGQQPQQASHLLRAMQRRASVPDVFAHGAASSARGKYRQQQQAYISQVRRGAMPSGRK